MGGDWSIESCGGYLILYQNDPIREANPTFEGGTGIGGVCDLMKEGYLVRGGAAIERRTDGVVIVRGHGGLARRTLSEIPLSGGQRIGFYSAAELEAVVRTSGRGAPAGFAVASLLALSLPGPGATAMDVGFKNTSGIFSLRGNTVGDSATEPWSLGVVYTFRGKVTQGLVDLLLAAQKRKETAENELEVAKKQRDWFLSAPRWIDKISNTDDLFAFIDAMMDQLPDTTDKSKEDVKGNMATMLNNILGTQCSCVDAKTPEVTYTEYFRVRSAEEIGTIEVDLTAIKEKLMEAVNVAMPLARMEHQIAANRWIIEGDTGNVLQSLRDPADPITTLEQLETKVAALPDGARWEVTKAIGRFIGYEFPDPDYPDSKGTYPKGRDFLGEREDLEPVLSRLPDVTNADQLADAVSSVEPGAQADLRRVISRVAGVAIPDKDPDDPTKEIDLKAYLARPDQAAAKASIEGKLTEITEAVVLLTVGVHRALLAVERLSDGETKTIEVYQRWLNDAAGWSSLAMGVVSFIHDWKAGGSGLGDVPGKELQQQDTALQTTRTLLYKFTGARAWQEAGLRQSQFVVVVSNLGALLGAGIACYAGLGSPGIRGGERDPNLVDQCIQLGANGAVALSSSLISDSKPIADRQWVHSALGMTLGAILVAVGAILHGEAGRSGGGRADPFAGGGSGIPSSNEGPGLTQRNIGNAFLTNGVALTAASASLMPIPYNPFKIEF